MKLFAKDEIAKIDGKEIAYKSINVKVDLGHPVGEYLIGLNFETKNDKENILNNIDVADFELENKIYNDKLIIRPIVKVGTITFVPKMSKDTLTLLRLALQK